VLWIKSVNANACRAEISGWFLQHFENSRQFHDSMQLKQVENTRKLIHFETEQHCFYFDSSPERPKHSNNFDINSHSILRIICNPIKET
jgi:hypothetical protein